MKQLILLEHFILNCKATNAEHRQAIEWLQDAQTYIAQLEAKINTKPEEENE
jgi:hypothetical protein